MNSDLLYVIYMLGKRVLQLVLEQVGPFGQVVELFVSCDG